MSNLILSPLSFKNAFKAALYVAFLPLMLSLSAHAQDTVSASQLIKDLQSGNHIIYMRHSQTNRDQRDNDKKNFNKCMSQRNLSDGGKTLATSIGAKIKKMGIPIGQIFSSPYCRCKETAELTFGSYTIENDLQFSMSKSPEELKYYGERLKALMEASPSGKNNTVYVGHTSNLKEGLGVWPKPEAVIAVFKKTEDDIIFKGLIKPDDWK